jgi:hypothetical protein
MGSASIAVTLSAESGQTVTVGYGVSNGSATAPADYAAAGGTLTFAPGQTSQLFMVTIANDAIAELSETVQLSLDNPGNATLGTQSSATLTISDDDPQPVVQFTATNYGVNEDALSVTITVTLSGASDQTITVSYATSNGTATNSIDYYSEVGTLSFPPNTTLQTFTVPINDDTTAEPSETINLALSAVTGGASLGTQSTSTITITDNDPPAPWPLVEFAVPLFGVTENTPTATIIVTLSSYSTQTVTVNYATSNGTAVAPSDYVTASGTLTFAPGETTKAFTVAIVNDTTAESSDESLNLTLSAPNNAMLGTHCIAVLGIIDDEPLCT